MLAYLFAEGELTSGTKKPSFPQTAYSMSIHFFTLHTIEVTSSVYVKNQCERFEANTAHLVDLRTTQSHLKHDKRNKQDPAFRSQNSIEKLCFHLETCWM